MAAMALWKNLWGWEVLHPWIRVKIHGSVPRSRMVVDDYNLHSKRPSYIYIYKLLSYIIITIFIYFYYYYYYYYYYYHHSLLLYPWF